MPEMCVCEDERERGVTMDLIFREKSPEREERPKIWRVVS